MSDTQLGSFLGTVREIWDVRVLEGEDNTACWVTRGEEFKAEFYRMKKELAVELKKDWKEGDDGRLHCPCHFAAEKELARYQQAEMPEEPPSVGWLRRRESVADSYSVDYIDALRAYDARMKVERDEAVKQEPYTPEHLYNVAINTLMPTDFKKREALNNLVFALEQPDNAPDRLPPKQSANDQTTTTAAIAKEQSHDT